MRLPTFLPRLGAAWAGKSSSTISGAALRTVATGAAGGWDQPGGGGQAPPSFRGDDDARRRVWAPPAPDQERFFSSGGGGRGGGRGRGEGGGGDWAPAGRGGWRGGRGGGGGGGRGGRGGGGRGDFRSRRPPPGGPGDRGGDPDVESALRIPEATDPDAAAALAAAAAAAGVPTALVRRGRARLFREGSPIIFASAIDRLEGADGVELAASPPPGTPCLVADAGGAAFAWGWVNEASSFRVRLAAAAGEADTPPFDTPALLTSRIAAAVAARAALGLGSSQKGLATSDVYRVINSEGDRLSGLVVDRLGPTLVACGSAAWVIAQRPAVEAALRAAVPDATDLVWQTAMLKEEGLAARDGEGGEGEASEGEGGGQSVTVTEHGLRFTTTPGVGQKTGFYADQRDSRLAVRGLVRPGDAVLDLCCFSGGFAISAAAGGAGRVVGVDSSASALAAAATNAALNGVAVEWVKEDVAAYMRRAAAGGAAGGEEGGAPTRFDLVILDPPKLAPTKASLGGALRKYRSLNAAALRLVSDGGLLMTCSCSGAVKASREREGGVFLPMLRAAAADAGVRLTLLRIAGAAACHPVDLAYPEGEYLTNVLVRVERV